jgi:hypothetical protein
VSGIRIGGLKAAKTNKEKYGEDFYKNIGRKGGSKSRNGGFASKNIGDDGLTGLERAKVAGSKGGSRPRVKNAKLQT